MAASPSSLLRFPTCLRSSLPHPPGAFALPILAVWHVGVLALGRGWLRGRFFSRHNCLRSRLRRVRRRRGSGLRSAMRKGVMKMMRPMMRKVAFGVPAIALSAALACTMAGCGGTEGGQGGSNGNEPAGQTVDSVQTAEVAGFTIESVGDGSYYRGAAERQDGFWLRAKITNNNESAKAPSAFSARRRRHLRRGRCGVRRLRRPEAQRRYQDAGR